MFELDRALDLRPAAGTPGDYNANLDPGWFLGQTPYGGYPLTLAVKAAWRAVTDADGKERLPASAVATYLRRLGHGPCRISTKVVHSTRTMSFVEVSIRQRDEESLRATVVLAAVGALTGPSAVHLPPLADAAEFRPHEEGSARRGQGLTVHERFIVTKRRDSGSETKTAAVNIRVSLKDGRSHDIWSACLLSDALIPPLTELGSGAVGRSWFATVQLHVQFRAPPRPGTPFLDVLLTTRALVNGQNEVDVAVRDDSGAVVALSRQHALLLPWQKDSKSKI